MNNTVKLDFPFPKPVEQFSQQNQRTRRREAWRKTKITQSFTVKRCEPIDVEKNNNLAVKYILKDKHVDLEKLLENKLCENVLTKTRLEIDVKITRTKLDPRRNRNITAQIRLLHLAVLERKYRCLEVMLKFLEQNKTDLMKSILEPVTVWEDNHEIDKDSVNQEVCSIKPFPPLQLLF